MLLKDVRKKTAKEIIELIRGLKFGVDYEKVIRGSIIEQIKLKYKIKEV